MLQERVHAQHRVVRLDARRGDLRARPHRERDLRLLAVVDGEALEEQAAETGASATAASLLPQNTHRIEGIESCIEKSRSNSSVSILNNSMQHPDQCLKFLERGFRFACNAPDAVGLRETVHSLKIMKP